jgi:hypothetical protein
LKSENCCRSDAFGAFPVTNPFHDKLASLWLTGSGEDAAEERLEYWA